MTAALLHRVHNARSHRIDARQVAVFYGLSLPELARAIDINFETLKKRADAPSAQEPLTKLVNAGEILLTVFKDEDAVRRWVRHPIPRFKGKTPLWLLKEHGADSFEGLALELTEGSYG